MADAEWDGHIISRHSLYAFTRAVAAAVKREDARKFRSAIRGASESMDDGELYEVCDAMRDEADALAPRQEPAQFTDSTGRKVLMPLDGSKVVGTVEPNEAKEART
jgi:hypothetical protein